MAYNTGNWDKPNRFVVLVNLEPYFVEDEESQGVSNFILLPINLKKVE